MNTQTNSSTLQLDETEAPRPSLACPSWCTYPAGHTWESVQEHGDRYEGAPANVNRYHERHVADLREGGGVYLRREDMFDLEGDRGEYVVHPSHLTIDLPHDRELGFTTWETAALVGALAQAHGLLVEGIAAGDRTA